MQRINQARRVSALAAAAGAASLSLLVSQAVAQTYQSLYTTSTGTKLRNDWPPVAGSVGNVFQMAHDVVIDQVGFIDAPNGTTGTTGDGLKLSHEVGIWHSGWNPEGDATVQAGTASPLDGGYRWVTLSEPITLAAGFFYTVGGSTVANDGDQWYDLVSPNWNTAFVGTLGSGTRAGRYYNPPTGLPPNPLTDPLTKGEEPLAQNGGIGGQTYLITDVRGVVAGGTWAASGSGSNWSTAANWQGGTAPVFTGAANSLTFGSSTNTTINNDTTGASLRGITFSAAAPSYTMTGNGFTLMGGIENDSPNTQTINNSSAITLYRDQSFNAAGGDIVVNAPLVLQDQATYTGQTIATYGSHNVTLNGAISGTANLWANPSAQAATLTLSNDTNSFSGTFQVYQGSVNIAASHALGAPGDSNGGGTIMNGGTSVLRLVGDGLNVPEYLAMNSRNNTDVHLNAQLVNVSGNNTWSGRIDLTSSGGANQHAIESDAGTLTLSGLINANANNDPRRLTFQGAGDGVISGTINETSTTPIRVTIAGPGTWSITSSGQNYSGGTSVNGGTLALDNTNDNGDKISGGLSQLGLGGGTLHLIGNASSATNQSVISTVVGALPPMMSGGVTSNFTILPFVPGMPGSVVQIDPGAGQSATLDMGPLSRNAYGTVDFRGTGTAHTTTPNTNGILGGWATVNNGADFAAVDGSGNVIANPTYTADAWASGNNTDVQTSSSPASGSTTNSVRFNTSGNTVTLSGNNVIQSGGILVTSNAGAGGATITGGTIQLTNSNTAPDLIVHQYDTAGALTIASPIANDPSTPASRSGTVFTYTSGGNPAPTVEITVPSGTGDLYVGMPVTGTGTNSATFTGSITAVIDSTHILVSSTPTIKFSTNYYTNTTLNFTSANGLSKAGPGDLVLSGNSTITGGTAVGAGRLILDGGANTGNGVLPSSIVTLNQGTTLTIRSSSAIGGLAGYGTVDTGSVAANSLIVGGVNNNDFFGNMQGSGGLTISKTGMNQLTVYGTASYTGPTVINSGGRLNVRNAGFLNNTSPVTINAGGEIYLLVNMNTNQNFTIGSTGFLGMGTQNNSGALHIGGNATVTSAGTITLSAPSNFKLDSNLTFTQSGPINTAGNALDLMADGGANALISGAVSGAGSLSIDTGTWNLTGANTYSGNTTIQGNATLNVASLGTVGGGASNLGTPADSTIGLIMGSTANVANVTGPTAGTLVYSGAGETTSRGLTLLGKGGTISSSGTGPITFTGPVNLGTANLTLNGTGNGALTGAITTTTTTGTLTKSGAGTWTISGPATLGNVTSSGGHLDIAASTGTVKLATLTATAANLDVANNDLVLTNTTAANLLTDLSKGRAGGAWNGATGLTSSTAAADPKLITAIGWAPASALGATTWGGMSVNSTDLLTKVTYYGDLNMDGVVNADDYALMDRSLAKTGQTGWVNGDLNYDGVVNSADMLLMDTAYGKLSGQLSAGLLADREAQFGSAYVAALTAAVPEPASLSLVGLAVAGLAARRRRR